jgi:ABC-type nitrate/sulfonate/bicarbonate transport system substrate-binding protein
MSSLTAYTEIKSRLIDLMTVGSLGSAKKARQSDDKTVRVGFHAAHDCAPLVMAKELELDHKYGFKLELAKDSSWMNVRDKLLTGDIDAAHCLWSLPLSVAAGVSEPRGAKLPIAMTLSANGQGITLSSDNFPIPFGDLQRAGKSDSIVARNQRRTSHFRRDVSRRHPRHVDCEPF